jgi:Ca-activated chloride channel family protein
MALPEQGVAMDLAHAPPAPAPQDESARLLPRTAVRLRRSARTERIRLRVCAWLALIASTAAGAQDPAGPEGLLVRTGGGDWRETIALESRVDFRIRGLLAEVSVRQRYVNDSGEWLEGRYLLPLPGDAAVGRLRLTVGERVIEGEVREKEEAAAVYEAAAQTGQVASLVEQQRANLFSTAVANIGPGEAVEIEIGYWQQVDFRDGGFSVSLPLTITPRYEAPARQPRFERLDTAMETGAAAAAADLGEAFEPTASIFVDLDAGVPLASVTSPTHAIHVEPDGRGYHVRLTDWVEASDRDFELRWMPTARDVPQQALFAERLDGETYLMLMLVPPTVPVDPVPRELVLVVDNSGSMEGEPMRQAIAALDRALSRLRPSDRFNVVRFDDTTEQLFAQSVPADTANVAHARRFVQALRADGGTELLPALELAFAGAPVPGYLRQVVLLTDAGVGNEQELLHTIETRRGDARLFAVGIGNAPNEHFLRRAVELGRGTEVLVRDIASVDADVDALLTKLDSPAMRDLAVRWPADAQMYPAQLPDLYAGEPLQAVAKLPHLGGAAVLEGQRRHRPWSATVDLASAIASDESGIARLWARARITALEDALRQGAEEPAIRAQVLDVALRHQLVSRYTSLVAVDRTPVRPGDADLASARFANAVPAGSIGFAQGATPARMQLTVAIALALLALLVLGRRRVAAAQPGHAAGAGRFATGVDA